MSEKKILVLGAGLIGKEAAIILSKNHDVTCADMQLCSLEMLSPQYPITVIPIDFKKKAELKKLIQDYDLVINAAPSLLGFETLKTLIEGKKNVINLALFHEEVSSLDAMARTNNLTVVFNWTGASALSLSTSSVASDILNGKFFPKGISYMKNELITA